MEGEPGSVADVITKRKQAGKTKREEGEE